MDAIAKTSLLTAAMRAVETGRSDGEGRLFLDPYAELLAGDKGNLLLQKAIAVSGDQPAIAIRTSFMDKRIEHFVSEGLRQIVILAAGMDTRSYRLNFPKETEVFELDRKEVFDYKNEKLNGMNTKCARHCLAVDLREEWQEQLIQIGFKSGERTLWLVEGLLMYLEEHQVIALLKRINTLASTNDVMLFDVLTKTLLEAPHMKAQLGFLASIGAPWRFGTNEPEEFMSGFGWNAHATQPGEFAPTRWPFPTAPREARNVPRGFYIEAIKE